MRCWQRLLAKANASVAPAVKYFTDSMEGKHGNQLARMKVARLFDPLHVLSHGEAEMLLLIWVETTEKGRRGERGFTPLNTICRIETRILHYVVVNGNTTLSARQRP